MTALIFRGRGAWKIDNDPDAAEPVEDWQLAGSQHQLRKWDEK
jgi:hypothetical protein